MYNIHNMLYISIGANCIFFALIIVQIILSRGNKQLNKQQLIQLTSIQQERVRLLDKIEILNQEQTQFAVDKEVAIEKSKSFAEEINRINNTVTQLTKENNLLKEKVDNLITENLDLNAQNAAVNEVNKMHLELKNQYEDLSKKMKEQLSEHFGNVSQTAINQLLEKSQHHMDSSQQAISRQVKILMDQYSHLSNEKEKNISNLTQPIKDQLDVLNRELISINTTSKSLDDDTKKLIQALKGDSKIRGDFGEMQLRNLVEQAGMVENCDFILQETTVDDTRPDMIIRMPNKNALVVDSKNLTKLYWDIQDDINNPTRINIMMTKVRDVVKQLGRKQYQESVSKTHNLETLDYVILFLPNEAIYSFVLRHDPQILQYSMDNRVLIVSPVVLISLLKVVETLWTTSKISDTAQEVYSIGQKIYQKLITTAEHIQKLGKSLDDASNKYNDMIRLMWNGRDNLRMNVEKLRELNIKNIGIDGEKSIAELEPITNQIASLEDN